MGFSSEMAIIGFSSEWTLLAFPQKSPSKWLWIDRKWHKCLKVAHLVSRKWHKCLERASSVATSEETSNHDIYVTFWAIPPKVLSFIGTFRGPKQEYSWNLQNGPEGEMDPFPRVLGFPLKVDKRHAIKANIGFLKSEPALDFSEFRVFPGTLCEA